MICGLNGQIVEVYDLIWFIWFGLTYLAYLFNLLETLPPAALEYYNKAERLRKSIKIRGLYK
jgi:hypothetical protein